MSSAYLFAMILAAGYVGSRFIFARLRITGESRQLFLLGGEYLFVGYLLGPSVLNILSAPILNDFAPVLVVGIGWLGLLLGNQLSFHHLRRFPTNMYKMLVWENLFFLVLFAVVLLIFRPLFLAGATDADHLTFWVLLASMTATSPTALSILSHIMHLPLRVTLLLRFLSSLEGLFGILILGAAYSFLHPAIFVFSIRMTGLMWLAVSVFLGVLGGWFFHLIIRESDNEYETVLLILGVIIYTGGLAYYLHISALFVAFLVGLVMANLSRSQIRINQILAKTEKPFFIVFLIFAGAMWQFQGWKFILLAPVLYLLRALSKQLSTGLAKRLEPAYRDKPNSMGLGLASISGLALAMALEHHIINPGDQAQNMLNVVILLVLVNQVAAPLLFRPVLKRLAES